MPEFRDNKDRRWSVNLTIGSAKRVSDATGVNLIRVLDDPDLLPRLWSDPILLVDVLYVLVQDQADKQGISDVEFGESLTAASVEDATKALMGTLVDFFPSARRAALRKILDRAEKETAEAEKRVQTMLDDGTIDREIDKAFSPKMPTSGTTSGD